MWNMSKLLQLSKRLVSGESCIFTSTLHDRFISTEALKSWKWKGNMAVAMEQWEESVITIEMMNGIRNSVGPWREDEHQIVIVEKVTNISGTHKPSQFDW